MCCFLLFYSHIPYRGPFNLPASQTTDAETGIVCLQCSSVAICSRDAEFVNGMAHIGHGDKHANKSIGCFCSG